MRVVLAVTLAGTGVSGLSLGPPQAVSWPSVFASGGSTSAALAWSTQFRVNATSSWGFLKSRGEKTTTTTTTRKPIQVVLDIDDTVKSSGNVRLGDIPLGGIDGQYERSEFYPGVFDFVAELACAHGAEPEPAAVLTARAREFKFALELTDEDGVVRAFRRAAKKSNLGVWGISPDRVMYGSAHEWLFQDFKAWRKFANFELLAEALGDLPPKKDPDDTTYPVISDVLASVYSAANVTPTRDYVFVGDTGEMDRQAGELILSRHPELASSVFLHCVSPSPDGSDVYVPVDYAVGGSGRVYHFRTYVGAAFKAVKAGLLDRAAFDRVAAAALRDLDDRGLNADAPDPRNKRRDVLDDIDRAHASLGASSRKHAHTNNLCRDAKNAADFDDDDDDDGWCPNKNPRDSSKPAWWERPLVQRFVRVGGPDDDLHRRPSSKKEGIYLLRPWRLLRRKRRARRTRRTAKAREAALASSCL